MRAPVGLHHRPGPGAAERRHLHPALWQPDLLNLVVAKGYLTKLLTNEAVKSYIGRHEPEILTHLELVVNTVSMEEAVQQGEAT